MRAGDELDSAGRGDTIQNDKRESALQDAPGLSDVGSRFQTSGRKVVAALETRVRAMTVRVPLEIKESHLQVSGRPEQRAVETLAPNRADQAFDEWMRQRHIRHPLDDFRVEDS
jgi:hypothetical protein